MSEFIYEWEKQLYQLAFQDCVQKEVVLNALTNNKTILNKAYSLANDITKEHSKTFLLASSLLSREKRKAVRALYAFCRITDDLVDIKDEDPRNSMAAWRHPIYQQYPNNEELISIAWADARKNFKIPWHYSEQLIQGVSQDITKNRYDHFGELVKYCYGVASTVGLMSMHIVGFKDKAAYAYAIRLGVALQLTNILRDIGEDWQAGRAYLPKDELEAFDLSYDDIAQGEVTSKWRAFMQFQISRNRRLYAEAKPGIALLNRDGRFAIAAAADLYEKILSEIENNDYNVFTQRASVNKIKKIKEIPGIWKRAMLGNQ